jgi:hypothetical protein
MSGRVAGNTIAYPFQILAWEEDNGEFATSPSQ